MTLVAAEDSVPDVWMEAIGTGDGSDNLDAVLAFVRTERLAGKIVYPPEDRMFAALRRGAPERVRVVIIGQDPYHGPGQAHGLAFSVPPSVRPPPSLANIVKELTTDLGCPPPRQGTLEHWVEQGVLLLNTVLTVEAGRAGSHRGKGWEQVTARIIDAIANRQGDPTAFILWGSHAQEAARRVDRLRHFVIESVHPSPLSAYRGFFGSRPFSRVNDWLTANGRPPIDWALPV
jgi:uracil-DNA glycosylase